ncbi:MAG: hypothetical protein MUF61_00590 [archaeon]|jgi:hypothetical protein|nr:hypothetical protein [archaeon]
MLVKVLGGIDLLSALVILSIIAGAHPYFQILLFCSGLLLLKGMFIFTGDILSIFDILCSIFLILSIFFSLPAILLWLAALAMFAKGFVSFL